MLAYIDLGVYNIHMPYKDPQKQIESNNKRMQELKNDPEKWAEFLAKKRDYIHAKRKSETKEEREKRLEKRRAKYLEKNPGIKPKLRFASEEERLEHERTYHREYARQRYIDDPETSYAKYREYWANTTPERRAARRAKQTENARKIRELHPERPSFYYMRGKVEWTNGINCLDPAVWKTAEMKAMELAAQLGYTDIFQPDFVGFYFDFAARKDGQIAVFQVTTLRNRAIKRKHIELAGYFGFDYFIVHVKPTLDIAFITPICTDPLPTTKGVNYFYKRGTPYEL